MSSSEPLKIIFAGTPDFSVPPLKALIDSPHDVIAVFTQPDRPAGRGRKLTPSPVKACAQEHNIPVYQPEKLKSDEEQSMVLGLKADLMVVVAYGIILPKVVLDAPRLGCINIHASLLPRWRGAAPIQRAILAGDRVTGITIMQMDVGLDTGDMLHIRNCEIEATDTGSSLHDRLSVLGAEALMEALPAIADGTIEAVKQDDNAANYAQKLHKSEALIDWSKPAPEILLQVNAFNAWPVAQTPVDIKSNGKPEMMRIWQAEVIDDQRQDAPGKVVNCNKLGIDVATGQGLLRLKTIQMPGKKPMEVQAFVNSVDLTGQLLGTSAS